MDFLTHIVSGIAASSVIAASTASKHIGAPRILAVGALGGALPDIDAISLWSKFDATIGKWFGLAHTGGEIYSAKFWYSHHAFFHSITAAILIGFLLGCLAYLFHYARRKHERSPFGVFMKTNLPVYLAFVAGCLAHAAGDLITPASTWGGVCLFWPFPVYVGGWGNVWWWNNYDLFLIISVGALLSVVLVALGRYLSIRMDAISILVAFLLLASVWRQTTTRKYDYAYDGYTRKYAQMEQKSKLEQQRVLHPKIYRAMECVDNWLVIHF
jgi:hypothetical protein